MKWREIESNFHKIPVSQLMEYFVKEHRDFLNMYDEDVLPYELEKLPPELHEFARQSAENQHTAGAVWEGALRHLHRSLLFPDDIPPEWIVNPEARHQIETQIDEMNAFSQEITQGIQVKRRKNGRPSFLVFTTDKEEDITIQTLLGHSDPDNPFWYKASTYWGYLKPQGIAQGHYDGLGRDHLTIFRDEHNYPSTYRLSVQEDGKEIHRPLVPWSHMLVTDYEDINQLIESHTINIQRYMDGTAELDIH